MTIFVMYEEVQDDHGFVDTAILGAVTTKAEAEACVTAYEDQGLKDGERVNGRVDEWLNPRTREVEESDWNTDYGYAEVELDGGELEAKAAKYDRLAAELLKEFPSVGACRAILDTDTPPPVTVPELVRMIKELAQMTDAASLRELGVDPGTLLARLGESIW